MRLPRATLLGAALVFAGIHLLPFVVDGYAALMASRVIAAVACATYWAVGAVLATRLSPDHLTARAMAAMVGGLTLANVLGVPLGPGLASSSAGAQRSSRSRSRRWPSSPCCAHSFL